MITRGKHNKILFTEKGIQFLKDNYLKKTNQELANALGLKLTIVRMQLYALDLKRIEMEYWTEEQTNFLIENYKTIGDVELSEIFEETWPKNKRWTKNHIEKKRRYLELKRTKEEIQDIFIRNLEAGRFKVCAIKRWERTGSNPIGTIVFWNLKQYNYKIPFIKTEEAYVHYYRWLYENKYGKLTSKSLVVPKLDAPLGPLLSIEQLECIDRYEHQRRNVERRMAYPEEVRKAIRLHKKLNKELNNQEDGK